MEKLLGQYMLSGWILLAETCPKCNQVPLLQQRNNSTRKCVCCEAEPKQVEPITISPIADVVDGAQLLDYVKASITRYLGAQTKKLLIAPSRTEEKDTLELISQAADVLARLSKV